MMENSPCFASPSFEEAFLPATLQFVRRCPARSDYIELFFATAERMWRWCFPEPPEKADHGSEPLALAVGSYGAQAHTIDGGGLGPAVPSVEALPAILDGTRVYVARRLVARGL